MCDAIRSYEAADPAEPVLYAHVIVHGGMTLRLVMMLCYNVRGLRFFRR